MRDEETATVARQSAPPPPASPPPADNTAATAGRGFLVITAAKLWFMVGGVLITFGLPFIFESGIYGAGTDGLAMYGQYTDLNNTLSILSMVMVTGVMQSVSKFVSERPDAAGGIVRQARVMMLLIGLLVGGGFVLAAPWIAEERHNPGLVNGYRAAGGILLFYAIYTVFIGTLNGRKQFFRQALFDIGFTSLKAVLVLGLALAGLGVVGAFSGFAMAAFIIMALAAWRVGRGLGGGEREPRLYAYAAKVMLYTLVFNLIFKLDVVMLKPAAVELYQQVAEWMPAAFSGLRTRAVEASADGLMGLYGTAVGISRVPWQATIAITFVVFPLVSEATFAADRARTLLYIRQTMRYTTLLVGAAAVVLMAVPHAVVGLLPARYADAVVPLMWLAPAYFCFSLFNVVNTLLMSADRAGTALAIGAGTVGLAAALYQLVLPNAGDGIEMLRLTGISTLACFATGLLAGLAVLWRTYGWPMPVPTLVRALLIGGALVAAGRFLPAAGKVVSLALAAGIGVAFLGGMVLTGEFGQEDRQRLARILRRRKP